MLVRKLFIVIAIISGLLAFQGNLAVTTPHEKTRIEVVIQSKHQEVVAACSPIKDTLDFFVTNSLLTSSSHHLFFHSLLISSIHHHSTL